MTSTRRSACSTTCVMGEVSCNIWKDRRLYVKWVVPPITSAYSSGNVCGARSRCIGVVARKQGRKRHAAPQQRSQYKVDGESMPDRNT